MSITEFYSHVLDANAYRNLRYDLLLNTEGFGEAGHPGEIYQDSVGISTLSAQFYAPEGARKRPASCRCDERLGGWLLSPLRYVRSLGFLEPGEEGKSRTSDFARHHQTGKTPGDRFS